MAALRHRKIVATLLKLTRGARRSRSLSVGPGCTCESCVQAWDRAVAVVIVCGNRLPKNRPLPRTACRISTKVQRADLSPWLPHLDCVPQIFREAQALQ